MFRTFAIACFAAAAHSMKTNMMLAQTEASAEAESSAKHTCTSTADRNKKIPFNFSKNIGVTWGKLRDSGFSASADAIYWADMGEQAPDGFEKITWARAYNTFASKGKSLFGDGISTDDVNQGSLGNCWFLSAASAIAEYPGRMEKVFLNTESPLNYVGMYGVTLWSLGVPHSIIVDDYLPLKQSGDKLVTMFANLGDDGSLWTAILEKAFAKYYGNYVHIEGGDAGYAVRTMTGAPRAYYKNSEKSADELWAIISAADLAKDIITASSPAGSDKTTDSSGLVQGHAFTVPGVVTLSNGVRLVKVRNPWGSEKYSGKWSDSDTQNWTDALRLEAGVNADKEDGLFHMDIDTFQQKFANVTVNKNTEGMHHDYHLIFNDNSTPNGTKPWCGAGCTQKKITVWSKVSQKVWVTANLWDERALSQSCKENRAGKNLSSSIGPDDYGTNWTFKSGSQQLDPIQMNADEQRIFTVELDFTDPNIAKDWSVTVWGESGEVYVYDNSGQKTMHFRDSNVAKPADKPALPAYDTKPFFEWANGLNAPANDAKLSTLDRDNRRWVYVNNPIPASDPWIANFTFSFANADMDAIKTQISNCEAWTNGMLSCTPGATMTECKVSLKNGQSLGFILEPGFSNAYRSSWSYTWNG